MIESFRRHKPGTVVDIANLDTRLTDLEERHNMSIRVSLHRKIKMKKRLDKLEGMHHHEHVKEELLCPHSTNSSLSYKELGHKFCRDCGEELS